MGAKVSKAGKSVKTAKPSKTAKRDRTSVGAEPARVPPSGAAPPGEDASAAVEAAPRPFFLGRVNLRRRGWTESGIARFLGAADALAPNPVVRSAPHMRLYDEARVARVEATEDWRTWHAASQQRRETYRLRAEERARERADRFGRLGVPAEEASAAVAHRREAAARRT